MIPDLLGDGAAAGDADAGGGGENVAAVGLGVAFAGKCRDM